MNLNKKCCTKVSVATGVVFLFSVAGAAYLYKSTTSSLVDGVIMPSMLQYAAASEVPSYGGRQEQQPSVKVASAPSTAEIELRRYLNESMDKSTKNNTANAEEELAALKNKKEGLENKCIYDRNSINGCAKKEGEDNDGLKANNAEIIVDTMNPKVAVIGNGSTEPNSFDYYHNINGDLVDNFQYGGFGNSNLNNKKSSTSQHNQNINTNGNRCLHCNRTRVYGEHEEDFTLKNYIHWGYASVCSAMDMCFIQRDFNRVSKNVTKSVSNMTSNFTNAVSTLYKNMTEFDYMDLNAVGDKVAGLGEHISNSTPCVACALGGNSNGGNIFEKGTEQGMDLRNQTQDL